jgi:hypothetical protein
MRKWNNWYILVKEIKVPPINPRDSSLLQIQKYQYGKIIIYKKMKSKAFLHMLFKTENKKVTYFQQVQDYKNTQEPI